MGEELARAAVAALYFVTDKHGAILLAGGLQSLCEFGGSHAYAAHALYALEDTCAHITFGKFVFPCLQVVERQIGDVVVVVDGGDDLRVVGHFHCQRCAAVEGFLCGKHASAAVVE